MKKFKMFIVDDDRTDGGTLHIDNGVVVSNAARKPLPNNPDGHEDMAIGWERNAALYGVVRNFSLALGFVKDAAKILRKIFYTENIERKVSILISMLGLTLTNTTYAFNYLFLYKGDMDLSTFHDEPHKVTMQIMEGGISRLLKANIDTIYPIPFKDDPDTKNLYCDGIRLFQLVNYDIVDGIHYTNPYRNFVIGMVINSAEGKISDVENFPQTFKEIGGTLISGLDDYRHTSQNFFIVNSGTSVVLATLSGKVFLRCNTINFEPGSFSHKVFLLVCSNQDGVIDRYTLQDPEIGKTYEIDLNMATFLTGIQDQNFFFIFQTDNGTGEFDFEFLPDSRVATRIVSRAAPTTIPFFTLHDLYIKVAEKIFGGPDNAVSSLLSNFLNIGVTCGDGIRGFKDGDGQFTGSIRTKMSDLFASSNVQFNAGLGIEGKQLTLEEKAHYFDPSNPIALGEVKSLKVTLAVDMMANTFKIGSAPQDYEDTNGRDEFNNITYFSSPVTRVVKEFNLESPYRRDCYGFEYTRIHFDGKVTTDSNSDNDVWLVNVEKAVITDVLVIPENTPYQSIEPNIIKVPGESLTVGTIVIIDGPYYFAGTYTVVNVSTITGFTLIEVVEPIETHPTILGRLYTNTGSDELYVLKRGTYDVINGLLTPETVFNLEDMTIKRLIEKHGNWIRSLMWGFDDKTMPFLTTDKNRELYTSKDGKVYDEDADIVISDLAAPLFIPVYFEIEVKVPVNLPALLENNPAKCFSFTWEGNEYKGFLMKAGISISDNAQQVFKLLSAPDNDLSKLVV